MSGIQKQLILGKFSSMVLSSLQALSWLQTLLKRKENNSKKQLES